jgi:hypothetical protein
MAPEPLTYADIQRLYAPWAVNPFPTDNVVSELREMAEYDPTLYTGEDGEAALLQLQEAERNNSNPLTRHNSIENVRGVFYRLRRKLAPPEVLAGLVNPAPRVLEDRGQLDPQAAADVARRAGDVLARLQAERAARGPGYQAPNGGRRRRTRRGRKSRRKSLRQRK